MCWSPFGNRRYDHKDQPRCSHINKPTILAFCRIIQFSELPDHPELFGSTLEWCMQVSGAQLNGCKAREISSASASYSPDNP